MIVVVQMPRNPLSTQNGNSSSNSDYYIDSSFSFDRGFDDEIKDQFQSNTLVLFYQILIDDEFPDRQEHDVLLIASVLILLPF